MTISAIFCNFVAKIIAMDTASKLKRENVAEYLLYMWQVEDMLRALDLNPDLVEQSLVQTRTDLDETQKQTLREWYESLIDMMYREGVEEEGHLQLNRNTLSDLTRLHQDLLLSSKYADYNALYYRVLPYIVELRAKAGENKKGEIETCFDLLYGMLMLRLQQKEISDETLAAQKEISKFVGMLAAFYKKDFNNELEL